MDITVPYIDMRIDAITDLGQGTPPEKLSSWVNEDVFIDMNGNFYYSVEGMCCQLERQDQLQEMIEDNSRPAWVLINRFYEWHNNKLRTISYALASMEQLWLAFVMKEKFNKIWDGKHWVNTTT